MTDVALETTIKAHQKEGDDAEAFCKGSPMERLKGRVTIEDNTNVCIAVAKNVPEQLLRNKQTDICSDGEVDNQYHIIVADMVKHETDSYFPESCELYPIIHMSRKIVFDYEYNRDEDVHYVYYRPALLKGRHIVNALSAVCWPDGVDEAELDLVRRKVAEEDFDASENGEGWEGVMGSSWKGGEEV